MSATYTFVVGDTVRTTVYLPTSFHMGTPQLGGIPIGEVAAVKRIEESEDGWFTVVLENRERGEFSIDQGQSLETNSFEKL